MPFVRRTFALFLALSWLAVSFGAAPAHAHQNAPAVLALREVSGGRFLLRWTPPSPDVPDLRVRLPGACRVNGSPVFVPAETSGPALVLECGPQGLGGELAFEAKNTAFGRVAVNVEWFEHGDSFHLSSGEPPTVSLGGTASPNSAFQVLKQYLGLGIEHIWFGIDHLLFLLGLLIVVRGFRSLLMTVTAFTVAHSLTLALAALELVSVPTSPVEICIALSVLLLAVEATRGPETLARRRPWVVAFGFGLLHGLGFASALSEVGLPRGAVLLSLVGFNLGVELGQLVAVALVATAYVRLGKWAAVQGRMKAVAVCALGSCSVFWLLQRLEAWLLEL